MIEKGTTCADHWPGVDDISYLDFEDWCREMSKTHRQRQCEVCKLYKIWVPKKTRTIT